MQVTNVYNSRVHVASEVWKNARVARNRKGSAPFQVSRCCRLLSNGNSQRLCLLPVAFPGRTLFLLLSPSLVPPFFQIGSSVNCLGVLKSIESESWHFVQGNATMHVVHLTCSIQYLCHFLPYESQCACVFSQCVNFRWFSATIKSVSICPRLWSRQTTSLLHLGARMAWTVRQPSKFSQNGWELHIQIIDSMSWRQTATAFRTSCFEFGSSQKGIF